MAKTWCPECMSLDIHITPFKKKDNSKWQACYCLGCGHEWDEAIIDSKLKKFVLGIFSQGNF